MVMHTKSLTRLLPLVITATFILVQINDKAFAQSSTWGQVHAILQTNCAGVVSCHSAGSSNPLTLIGTESAVYNNIVGVLAGNPSAATKGYKLVDPGYPHRSFLLKKVNNGLDPDNDQELPAEGSLMPQSPQPALSATQIDLISAWILNGAPQTGIVVDSQLISDYYSGLGLPQMTPPPAPDPAEGFQIHFGPIFIAPGVETEYFKKHTLPNIPDSVEVDRLHTFINEQSHHFLIYKYFDSTAANSEPEGLSEVTGLTDAFPSGTNMVAAWQNTASIVLPEGTAYFWEGDPTLSLDLHIRNYNSDSILRAEVYTNIYYQPKQPQTVEMIAEILFYSSVPCCLPPCVVNCATNCFLPTDFCIPNDGLDITFSGSIIPPVGENWHVWLLSAHTHKFGIDYDMYLRNPGGGQGDQIYEGWYSYDYTFPTSFFDFEHPPVKIFDEDSLNITSNDGLIHEATYNNDSVLDVGFGITTNDEMFLTFIQYSLAPWSTGISGIDESSFKEEIKIYPNPFSDETTLELPDKELSFVLYNVLGKEVKRIDKISAPKTIIKRGDLSGGIYLYKIMDDSNTLSAGKLIIY